MNILVACEFSGEVRRAFRMAGHNAWSCDIIPASDGSSFHIQDDVLNHLEDGWDMMIAFPPCTYLCSSGLHWNNRRPGRDKLTHEAILFALNLAGEGFVHNPIKKIAIENPVGRLSTAFRKPDQIIHPWQFGHPESKSTCLWLKGLPRLKHTDVLSKPASGRWDNQTPSGQNKLGPSKDRAARRSITYSGIAKAMADQWGKIEENKTCTQETQANLIEFLETEWRNYASISSRTASARATSGS